MIEDEYLVAADLCESNGFHEQAAMLRSNLHQPRIEFSSWGDDNVRRAIYLNGVTVGYASRDVDKKDGDRVITELVRSCYRKGLKDGESKVRARVQQLLGIRNG